jgi:hypothetical protein
VLPTGRRVIRRVKPPSARVSCRKKLTTRWKRISTCPSTLLSSRPMF